MSSLPGGQTPSDHSPAADLRIEATRNRLSRHHNTLSNGEDHAGEDHTLHGRSLNSRGFLFPSIKRGSGGSVKGKEKAQNGSIHPQRGSVQHWPQLDTHDTTQPDPKRLSTAGDSWQSGGSGHVSSGSEPLGGNLWKNSLGQDTNPTQLVNLALSLSESRRRNVSGGLLRSPRDVSGGRRVVSTGLNGSHRQFLQEPRRSASHGSSKSKKSKVESETDSRKEPVFQASDATLARAEKARIALEIGYEHRRLLQYLPALPKPTHGKNSSSQGNTLGREYNPLQYIRNRRIRLREKKPLNPELQGWKDIDRVRAWVDNVKNDREVGIARVDDRFPLPTFDALKESTATDILPDSPTVMEQRDSHGRPLRRPTKDWLFFPWEMLADIYWLDQDHNLDRIEDASGRTIQKHGKRKELPVWNKSSISLTSEADREPPMHSKHIHLGHNRHSKARQSKSSAETEELFRAHIPRWPKRLLRSKSFSSDSESDRSRKSLHYPNYEESSKAILEKQMMQMAAVEEHKTVDNHTPRQPEPLTRTKSPRTSLEKGNHHRTSSDDRLSTPTSPIPSLAPSIAVDKSPSTSALSPIKRPFMGRLGSFRRDRSRSLDGRAVSDGNPRPIPITRQTTKESPQADKSKSTRSSGSLLSPIKIDIPDANLSDSKSRGNFRGRIAELVGNEVSRVGDKIWKRDSISNMSQLTQDVAISDDSDDDDAENNPTGTRSSNSLSLVQTKSSGMNGQPKYYTSNLPTFRSPFTRESTMDDHITRQQRERGRSTDRNRLALPRIDMRSISSSPSRSRSQSPDAVGVGSTYRSDRVKAADKRLNDFLGMPGKIAPTARPPTGLARYPSKASNENLPKVSRRSSTWNICDGNMAAIPQTVRKRDIARVRALLLSSGVKAYEITRRTEEPSQTLSPLLQNLQDVIKDPIQPIPPSQEFVFAARALIRDIESTYKELRDAAESFSTNTVDALHERIQAIDVHVNNTLTADVRKTADDADSFGAELANTHPLSMKRLNDSIDEILRMRRHKMRWLRRGGWTILEWLVLGILWITWLIAVIIRVARCAATVIIESIRWLLWL